MYIDGTYSHPLEIPGKVVSRGGGGGGDLEARWLESLVARRVVIGPPSVRERERERTYVDEEK